MPLNQKFSVFIEKSEYIRELCGVNLDMILLNALLENSIFLNKKSHKKIQQILTNFFYQRIELYHEFSKIEFVKGNEEIEIYKEFANFSKFSLKIRSLIKKCFDIIQDEKEKEVFFICN